ncbi:50S ribosomal protein L29 [Rhodopirellula maiorica SM1]|uniref:Large ribosomal subunit protein uL29 n=1 Tax=Rhodopirellula maiorica SM1 TaxID=1265738 RepID=M5RQ55_9BACT|nr:50S ribosomal protein L29 [Rhodopirellula maiorica SM1]
MTKTTELREMSDDQLEATAKEAGETLFRLRFQSQSERLNTPSEIKKKPTPDRADQNDPN